MKALRLNSLVSVAQQSCLQGPGGNCRRQTSGVQVWRSHILSCFELAGRPAVYCLYSCSLPSSACCRLGGPAGMLHMISGKKRDVAVRRVSCAGIPLNPCRTLNHVPSDHSFSLNPPFLLKGSVEELPQMGVSDTQWKILL